MAEIKIEILDYFYGTGKNLADATKYTSFNSSAFTLVDDTTVDVLAGGGTFEKFVGVSEIVLGIEYNVSFDIFNYSGSGTMGVHDSSVGLPNTLIGDDNGHYSATFTATSSGTLNLFGRNTNSGTISNIKVQETTAIDWDRSVVGELDITSHEDFPLALTFAISDIKNIDARSGVFSKTFKIPATKHNNKLLKNIYIVNSHINNNILSKKKCRITINGLPTLDGLIKITGTNGYGDVPSHYNCVFFGNNLSWAKEIEDASLSDIDWGDGGENLKIDRASISSTWAYNDNTSSNSPIVYPIASYGRINEDGVEGTMQYLQTKDEQDGTNSGKDGYFGFDDNGDYYGNPTPELDWRPMIWVKDTLVKIFDNIGYTVVSNFMDTQMFKQLVWALPNAVYNSDASKERNYDYTLKGEWVNEDVHNIQYIGSVPSSITSHSLEWWDGDNTEVISFTSGANDFSVTQGSNLNTTTGVTTINEYGYYDVKLDLQGRFNDLDKGGSVEKKIYIHKIRVAAEVKTVGQSEWRLINHEIVNFGTAEVGGGLPPVTTNWAGVNINFKRYFNIGDEIRFIIGSYIKSETNGQAFTGNTEIRTVKGAEFSVSFNGDYMEYGQLYNLKDVINTEYKQMDFFKGIAHAFNLQITTHETDRIIYIEPFDDFYLPKGLAIDWTDKIARDKELSSKWIKSDLKRSIVFKYKSDGKDKKVEERGKLLFDGIKDEHPYLQDLGEQWVKGSSKFENPFFSGTYCDKDTDITVNNVSTFNTACLWESDSLAGGYKRAEKGYGFEPRLLYWDRGLSGNANRSFSLNGWGSSYFNFNGNIPQAVSYDTDNLNSPNLCYGNVNVTDYDSATDTFAASVSHKGLYETYYKGIMEVLFQNPRVITAHFDLKVIDIINLDFRKLVYVDGVYYRINKISDYSPHKNTTTKVELIQWID